ncbi:MAG: nickel pincer cofactor biosynthesis protein LarC [Chloroflexi bacterium]|nr:nickel pincer cofactor biosynthesis protein LarC [Chloroflexota bacterium]
MIAYFDCFSGASGDMILGALVDAGLELADLERRLSTLNVPGYSLHAERVLSKGISGTRVHVHLHDHHHHEQAEGAEHHHHEHHEEHRNLVAILGIIERSGLSDTAKERASAIFRRLAEAEAKIHGVAVDETHFHEVGSVDAIVDICGAVVGLELLGVEHAYCSALPTGGGTVRSAHGVLPVPAPATLELLRAVSAPLRPLNVEAELVTPTGAAILSTLCQFRQPSLALTAVGYGFGQRELPWANTLRLWLGQATGGLEGDTVAVIEANIDDMPGELLGATMERLLGAGALDVYFTPIQMKKNRPAVKISVISPEEKANELARLVLAETTTLGVRLQPMARLKCERWQVTVETPFGPVLAKAKRLDERIFLSPEYEDAARAARERGVPLADVYAAVAAASLAGRSGVPPTA